MTNSQLMNAPASATRTTTDKPTPGMHLLEHPRGRGFSVLGRLAREVETPTAPPRHRREDSGPELAAHAG